MKKARRLAGLGSAVFSEMEDIMRQIEREKGLDIINLGIGSPDRPPASHIIKAMRKALENTHNFKYQLEGKKKLHQALATWYSNRFGVDLDPHSEIKVLMGSQDGLAHISLAYIDPGDIVLVPDPGYPIYTASVLLASGKTYPVPLLAKNNYLPDLTAIPPQIARQAKMMWVNYPNNPVAATAELEFFQTLVDFALEYQILICHDLAYCELAFDGYKPHSFLEIASARRVGIEFYSLSKTYNMAGCRIGFAVGNAEILQALSLVKNNIDYGVFSVVQEGGIAALEGSQDFVRANADVYRRRRDVLIDGLANLGWAIPKPKASMFVWAPLPKGYHSSKDFAIDVLHKTGILVIPGVAFGEQGEGYIRLALVREEEVLKEAIERLGRYFSSGS